MTEQNGMRIDAPQPAMAECPPRMATLLAAMALAALLSAAIVLPAAAQQAIDFSDQELQAFAAASYEVGVISQKWQPTIANAESTAESQELREQATAEMVEAVREQGISVDKYNNIYRAAQADPEVAETIEQYRQDMQ